MIEAALHYWECGLHPLVLDGKRPVGKWREIEWTRAAIIRAFQNATAIGIDCGKSGRVVVDYDKEEGLEYGRSICSPAGVIVKTQKGFHDHYRGAVGNRGNIEGKGIDIRSVGGVVRMPPTPGVTFLKNEELTDWNEDWFREQEYVLKDVNGTADVDWRQIRAFEQSLKTRSIAGQQGDSALFTVACAYIQYWKLPYDVALTTLQMWNAVNAEPQWPLSRLEYKLQEAIKLSHRQ